MRRALAFVVLAIGLIAVVPAPAAALELADYPELGHFIDEMVARHGFDKAELVHAFSGVRLKLKAVDAMERPREAMPWRDYKTVFLDEQHIERGVRFWKEHAEALARAQRQYGVPPEVILGVIGVESHFGHMRGAYRLIDVLTTFMLKYPPRAGYFRDELEQLLLLARDLHLPVESFRGSFAGAIGLPQFMPSSYRRYAVDFDGDGVPNLMTSADDAIGSIANFLHVHGWKDDEPILDDVRLEGTLYFWIEKLGVKPKLTVADLIRYGVFPVHHVDSRQPAALIEFEGDDGPIYRVGYDNFYVITRYNPSKRYALAITELSAMIKQQYGQSS
jgi:membrane-bound lytic murein transglycosylase B